MPTALDPAAREALLHRLRRLEPTSTATWGTLSAPRLLCHLADQLRVALGELPVRRTDTLLSRTLVKWMVVHTPLRPPPGKIQTAPEMLSTSPGQWRDDLMACESLLNRVGSHPIEAVHPYFGPLTPSEWGLLVWKHVDHHLRQFGV